MNNPVFACTHVEKCVEEDDFEKGCIGTRTCVLFERADIHAESLELLVEAIGDRYGLDLDDLFIPDEEGVNRIGYNRLENGDGDEPTASETARWKRGNLTLYLADYDFLIEKRFVEPINLNEFASAHIKYHG